MKNLQEFESSLDLPVTEKQSMLHTMGIVRTSGSRVDNSGMPIGPCRLKLGLIDRSAMPYSSSRGVHLCPQQNITTSLGWNKNRFTPKTPMNSLWEHARVCVSLSQKRNKNANWLVETKTVIDRLVCNAIQPVTKCPPTPRTKHQETTTSLGVKLKSIHPHEDVHYCSLLWKFDGSCILFSYIGKSRSLKWHKIRDVSSLIAKSYGKH
jgi:hypothetical protein